MKEKEKVILIIGKRGTGMSLGWLKKKSNLRANLTWCVAILILMILYGLFGKPIYISLWK